MKLEIIHRSAPRYKYFKVTDPGITGSEAFLYIGDVADVFANLSSRLGHGLSLASADQVISTLASIEARQEALPLVIIIDQAYQRAELKKLNQFLLGSGSLRSVALVFNLARLSASEKEEVISARMVDELIDLDGEIDSIAGRVRFINKMKTAASVSSEKVRIETANEHLMGSISFSKRMFDLVCSVLLLIIFFPVMVAIAVAIKLESKGPVFYNSYRAGRGFQIFKFFKFRTMKVGADRMIQSMSHLNKYNTSNGAVFFKINNDPRITRVGKFLRSTGLDELPQLFNVISGDMSIVGNRPLPLYEANTLTTDEWAERFAAPAGITGLWQVQEKLNSILSAEDRIKTDIYYSRRHNFMMDFRIMIRTIPILLYETSKQDVSVKEKTTISPSLRPELSL
jgi:lipopolysaccharide/colanic/teichoic acid biosynthesis glycosyltransferase